MSVPTIEGITVKTITTARLTTRVLFSGPGDGTPVFFIHGNTSSATWWEEAMVTLPLGIRGIAPDLRGFGEAGPDRKVDATRGTCDWADDAIALLDTLGIEKAHFVGSSLGGSVIWRLLMDHPDRFLSATQCDPGSPFGFGGTKDSDGTPCFPDYAGSGGGLANPELTKRLAAGDMSLESPFSPRRALRTLIVKPPFIPAREDALVASMCSMHIGPEDNPGDVAPSPNWPFVGPGKVGAANALSPKYAGDVARLYAITNKPPILWLRGGHDLIVSDTAMADAGYLAMLGMLPIPGYPGKEVFPPQPMLSQTRAVLQKYAAAGGWFKEVVIEDAGHAPYIERLEEFNRQLHAFLES